MTKITLLLYIYYIISCHSGVKHSHTSITTHLLSGTCNFDGSSIVTDDASLLLLVNNKVNISFCNIVKFDSDHSTNTKYLQVKKADVIQTDELMVDPYDREHTYAQSTVRNFIFGACAIFIGFFCVWTYQTCQLQNKFGKNNTSINTALRPKTILNSITYIYYHIIAMGRANSFILLITIFLSAYTTDAITNCKYLGNLPNGDAQKFVGFWNDTLFIFKGNNIWYSPFVLDVINWDEVQISSSNPLSWSNITVSIPGVTVNFVQQSQQFTQIDNLLYMQWGTSALEMLIFNMSDISFVDINTYNYSLPLTYYDCLTNNKTHIYVMGGNSNELYIYDIDEDKWIQSQSKFDEEIRAGTCAFNLDQSKMFAFGGKDLSSEYYDVVYEYDPINDVLKKSSETLNDLAALGEAITTSQNNIYVIGFFQRPDINKKKLN